MGTRVSQEVVDSSWEVAAGASAYASVAALVTWTTDFRGDVAKIAGYDLPVMILHGTHDRILPIDATARPFQQLVPRAHHVEIEGAPHALLWAYAEEVNPALRDFLRHRGRRGSGASQAGVMHDAIPAGARLSRASPDMRRSTMVSTTSPAHVPPLGVHQRNEIGHQLQATLVELIDLALVGKQLHWSVVGPHFRLLHLQLDEFVAAWRDLADAVAERAVALGSWPDGQATAVAAGGGFDPVTPGALADHAVVRVLTQRLAVVGERVRARMDRLGALDAASQDILIEVVRSLERQLWLIRAQAPLADGE